MEAQVKKLLTNSCLVLSLFISTQALAKQEKTVEDGEEFTAEISKTDINRIKRFCRIYLTSPQIPQT
jgi:hypothetical protein